MSTLTFAKRFICLLYHFKSAGPCQKLATVPQLRFQQSHKISKKGCIAYVTPSYYSTFGGHRQIVWLTNKESFVMVKTIE